MNRQFKFEVLADCQQFYLHDEVADCGELEWTQEATDKLLTVAPGVLGIGTVRGDFVPIVLELSDEQPDDDLKQWDQVNECSLEITSSQLIVANVFNGGNMITDQKIPLGAGTYRARLYYGDLASVTHGERATDHYRVVLWRAAPGAMRVLKQADVQLIRWASFVGDSSLSTLRTM